MRKPTKKTVVIAAAMAVLIGGGGGVAYGYWTNTGSGTATSTTAASLATMTTSQQGSITGLAPGSAVQDVDFTILNSATAQWVTTVAMSFTSATYIGVGTSSNVGTTWLNHPAGGPAPGCTAADFTLTQPEAGVSVPNPSLAFTQATAKKGGRIVMNNLGTNQDDCKDTTIALAFAIS
jgi:hypothetical protein